MAVDRSLEGERWREHGVLLPGQRQSPADSRHGWGHGSAGAALVFRSWCPQLLQLARGCRDRADI